MYLPETDDKIYPRNRRLSFEAILKATSSYKTMNCNDSMVIQGDSLDVIKSFKSQSIDLIVTDPPYHSTKKKNVYGDTNFPDDQQFLNWMLTHASEWKRVLKPNGSLYLFCSSDMAPYLYVHLASLMNMQNIITWTKPNEPGYDGWKQKMNKKSLRRWYPHSERIIFCTPAMEGNLKRSPFGIFLRECRLTCGLTANQLTELTGAYGKINNGGAVSNWETGRNIPNRKQYKKICEAFIQTGKINLMPSYEDVIRPFDVDPDNLYVDVWDQTNVRQYKGKHPAEKPVLLLEHIIKTSSYEGDIILDPFSGSGSTLRAAANLNRKSIGIEIDHHWARYSADRLLGRLNQDGLAHKKGEPSSIIQSSGDLPLFS